VIVAKSRSGPGTASLVGSARGEALRSGGIQEVAVDESKIPSAWEQVEEWVLGTSPRMTPEFIGPSWCLTLERADAGAAAAAQHEFGDRPDEGVETIGTAARGETVGAEVAHLIFEFRELPDV
jgi:hypothetical protein